MSNNQIYPPDQIKKAISILEAMLEPTAPDLSIELNWYLEYMNKYYIGMNKKLRGENYSMNYLNRMLERIEYSLKNKLINVQKSVENINTSQE